MEALRLLTEIGAPARLVRHAQLVGEAAEELIVGLAGLGVPLDAELVRVGVVLHDAGKSIHHAELDGPGCEHEPAGERLLLDHGATPDVARICRSHARWRDLAETLEELVVALADKLWKGARVVELETLVIDRAAGLTRRERWDLFTDLDAVFERIATGADERLARSRV
jgi:HD superfamily phosphodiesterase